MKSEAEIRKVFDLSGKIITSRDEIHNAMIPSGLTPDEMLLHQIYKQTDDDVVMDMLLINEVVRWVLEEEKDIPTTVDELLEKYAP